MRRGTSILTLVVAALVGITVGVLAFVQVGALSIRPGSADPDPDAGTPGGSSSASHRSPPPTDPSSASPSRTSASSPVSQSPSVPPFTDRALLQPEELQEHGWGPTTVVRTWDGYPGSQVSSCTSLQESDGEPVAAHAALYRGSSTSAVEIVVRFESEQAAASAMSSVRDRIEACRTQPDGDPSLSVQTIEASTPDGIDARDMWDTTGIDESAEGFVGLVRVQERIALVTMISLTTDPLLTTRYKSLTLLAGQRLV